MMFMLTTTCEVALMLGTLEVVDGMGDREHLGFLDASLETHPLLGLEVQIVKAIRVLCTQH